MSRQRTQVLSNGSGTAKYQGNSITRLNESESTSWHRCTDEFHVRDGAFTATHISTSGTVNGRNPPAGVPYREANNWVPTYFRNPTGTFISHLPVPDIPGLAESAVHVVAATNPSAPLVDLPVSILELVELPHLIRETYGHILKRIVKGAAKENLRYEYAIKPAVSDFVKLLEFKKAHDQQMKLLSKLRQGSVIRKAFVASGNAESYSGSVVTVHSAPSELICSVTRGWTRTSVQRWGYVLWTPDLPKFNRLIGSEADAIFQAKRILLGLTVDASTAWELLPWSWLADWFANMGEWISTKRSLIPVTAGYPSICTTSRTTVEWIPRPGQWCSNLTNGYQTTLVTKTRSKASASLPSANLPLLTGRQVGILTSLAVQRFR